MKSQAVVLTLLLPMSIFSVQANAFAPRHFLKSVAASHDRTVTHPNPVTNPRSHVDFLQAVQFPSVATEIVAKTVSCLRGGAAVAAASVEISDLVEDAYGWCMALGAPAALVAGAVVATMYENMNRGDLDIQDSDNRTLKFLKRFTRLLLMSSFVLEVMSIFTTTVTGTMLYSRTLHNMETKVPITAITTPLSFLRDNFEFEFLSAQFSFLQGLINWLAAIALGHFIPSGDLESTRTMNKFVGSALISTIVLILAFSNSHMTFYPNYGSMLLRWAEVTFRRFLWHWPPRPMAVFFIPSFCATCYWGWKAFTEKGPSTTTTKPSS